MLIGNDGLRAGGGLRGAQGAKGVEACKMRESTVECVEIRNPWQGGPDNLVK